MKPIKAVVLAIAVAAMALVSIGASAQAVPSDDLSLKVKANGTDARDSHLHVNYSNNVYSYINFNMSVFPANLTAAQIQKATLILYLEPASTSAGTITLCPIGVKWASATANGSAAPTCAPSTSGNPFSPTAITVTGTQLNGTFIEADVTSIVQAWYSGLPNNGLMLQPDAPLTGTGNGINVQIDSLKDNGNGYPATLDLVLQSQGPMGPMGPAGPIGANGANGTAGMNGVNGVNGTNGISAMAGTWSQTNTYLAGQSVMRPPSIDGAVASVGPYFNLTGSNNGDPAQDTNDWLYCCGTPSYAPIPPGHVITGNLAGITVPSSTAGIQGGQGPGTGGLEPGGNGGGPDANPYSVMGVTISPPLPSSYPALMFAIESGDVSQQCVIQPGTASCTSTHTPYTFTAGVISNGSISISAGFQTTAPGAFTITSGAITIQ